MNYYKKFRSERNIVRKDFNVDYFVENSSINGDFATVEIIEDITFYYDGSKMQTSIQPYYKVLLYKEGKNWLVCDIISDDDFDRYYKSENLSFDKLNSEAKKETLRLKSAEKNKTKSEEAPKGLAEVFKERIENDAKKSTPAKIIDNSFDPDGIEYDGYNAACYALTFSRTCDKENIVGDYNGNFYNYHPHGGDCQNFASQCIWAGFNGSNDPNAIKQALSPMNRNEPQWYWAGDGDRSPSWTGISNFKQYIDSSSNGARVKATKTQGEVNLFTSSLQIGDEVIVNSGGHAIIIVDIEGNDRYFSGHSPNLRRFNLSDAGYYVGTIIHPEKYLYSKNTSDGGNHSYAGNISIINGFDATCNNPGCSHNRMQVSGVYAYPIPKLAAPPIWLYCSHRAYRVAIGITAPNGKTTWHEELNVSRTYVNYDFWTEGEYTITLSARDKNPNIYSDSISTTVKYTMRIVTIAAYDD